MKKIFLILLLFSLCFICNNKAEAQRFVRWDGATRVVDSSSQYTIERQLRLPLGMTVSSTSFFTGVISLSGSSGILGNNVNISLINGGGYFLDGVNINTLFAKLTGRNTFTGKNTHDSLAIGSGLFTFGSSTLTLSNADFYAGTMIP